MTLMLIAEGPEIPVSSALPTADIKQEISMDTNVSMAASAQRPLRSAHPLARNCEQELIIVC